MDDKEINDRCVVAIRRAAVSEPHAVRRRMMQFADIFGGGIELEPDAALFYDTPVKVKGVDISPERRVLVKFYADNQRVHGEIENYQLGADGFRLQTVRDEPQA